MEQDLPERAAVTTKVCGHGDEMAKGLYVLNHFHGCYNNTSAGTSIQGVQHHETVAETSSSTRAGKAQ